MTNRFHFKIIITIILVLTSVLVWLGLSPARLTSHSPGSPVLPEVKSTRQYKLLHIASYELGWEWTEDQLKGFQDALKGMNVEYKVFAMDTKRKSSLAWKRKAGRQARALIESWKPDLVYTNDDNAQEYVTKYYINSKIPFVFSAVNAKPEDYGLDKASNITGVLEEEHFVQTVRLLQELKPEVRRIAVIVDDDPTWIRVIQRMKNTPQAQLGKARLVSWNVIHSYTEYQQRVMDLQKKVDALALLGIHTFKNAHNENVPWQEVLGWTAGHSRLPDFSFFKDRVSYGTLCTVYVSGYEQGLAAGKIARGILEEGKSPASFKIKPTLKGKPILSLARARQLGIKVKSSVLLSSEIVKKFAWETEAEN